MGWNSHGEALQEMVRGGSVVSTLPEWVRAPAGVGRAGGESPPDSCGTQDGGWGHGQPFRDVSWAWPVVFTQQLVF